MNYHNLFIWHMVYHPFYHLFYKSRLCLFFFFVITFCKKVLLTNSRGKFLQHFFWYFDILTWSPTLSLRSFFSVLKSIHMLDCTSIDSILMVLYYAWLYLLTISANLSRYTFFDIEFIYLSWCVEYTCVSLFVTTISLISYKILRIVLVIVILFLPFKETSHAYFL